MWQAMYFFRETNRLYAEFGRRLSEIGTSSTAADVRTKEVLLPTIEALLEWVRADARRDTFRSAVENMQLLQTSLAEAVSGFRQRYSMATTEEEKNAAYKWLLIETSGRVGLTRDRLAAAREEVTVGGRQEASPAPGSPSYDWCPFIRRLRDLEKAHGFLSVKWLRETIFAQEREAQQALQVAIETAILTTYHRPNPRNQLYPTLCCRLNPEHPVVAKCLEVLNSPHPVET